MNLPMCANRAPEGRTHEPWCNGRAIHHRLKAGVGSAFGSWRGCRASRKCAVAVKGLARQSLSRSVEMSWLANAILLVNVVGAGGCARAAPPPEAPRPLSPLPSAPPRVASVPVPPSPTPVRQAERGSPREVVAGLREQFSSCYQGGLWTNAAQRGSVRLELDIDAVGRPKAVNSSGGAGLDRVVL